MSLTGDNEQALLPGQELIEEGLRDLAAGHESEASLLVQIAAPRLRRLGIEVPGQKDGDTPAEHRLYTYLSGRPDAHSHYNALLARAASYARAAEHATPR